MFAAPSCDTKNGFPPSRERQYHFCHVQRLSSKKYGTLYTGITSNLVQRIWQHREGLEVQCSSLGLL